MSSSSSGTPSQPVLRLHCSKIYVRDVDKSLHFYIDQLGFTLAADTQLQTGERWVTVAPPDGTALLTLVAPPPDSSQLQLIGRHTDLIFITEDVIAKYREWSERGVRFLHTPRLRRIKYQGLVHPPEPGPTSSNLPSEPPVWGGVFTRFRDIDGNIFSLVSFDNATRQFEAQRRADDERREEERRATQELEIAKAVQARLFPQHLPELKTLDYAGVCVQARQVGGDYYDFLALGEERLGLVIGDVAGKGIAAALLMANLQASLRSQCAIAVDQTQRLLRSVNQRFCDNTPDGAYATVFFAEYDDRARRMRYVNCGHLSALLLRENGPTERLESTATVLGLFQDWDCSVGECVLSQGDVVALYTDGITEACNHQGEEFGEVRLEGAFREYRFLGAQSQVTAVLEEVQRFSPQAQQDDMTLIVARSRD